MGPVLFLLVPFATGFAIGMLSQDTRSLIAASILAAMFSLVMLIALGWEGTLCVLMAIPLLFIGLGVGAALGLLFNKLITKFRRGNNNLTLTSVVLLSMPLLILAGHRVEKSALIHPRRQVIISTIRLAAEPNEVWTDLQSFDSLSAKKPGLMHVGLPIPIRCVMEGAGWARRGLVISITATFRRRLRSGRRPTLCVSRLIEQYARPPLARLRRSQLRTEVGRQ
jgi:hypothetical protein